MPAGTIEVGPPVMLRCLDGESPCRLPGYAAAWPAFAIGVGRRGPVGINDRIELYIWLAKRRLHVRAARARDLDRARRDKPYRPVERYGGAGYISAGRLLPGLGTPKSGRSPFVTISADVFGCRAS